MSWAAIAEREGISIEGARQAYLSGVRKLRRDFPATLRLMRFYARALEDERDGIVRMEAMSR